MNKVKLFIENFLVYGLGGVISKLVPLLMLPIVTRLMPNTTYFGVSDMSNTIVSFASAFAIMGMYDAMYRMFFDKDEEKYKKDVCSTALIFTLGTSIIVFVIMLLFRNMIADLFFKTREYANILYITAIATLVGATNSIISAPTRMQNKKKIFLITNTVSSILSYSISVPMLLAGHYLIALPLAGAIASFVMEISFWGLNRKWFSIKRFDVKILKQLLLIGVPLLPNFLIYWVFNSSDKVMITNILDIGEAGVYSVGAKLGHASQLIYTAFAGGWQFFALSTMKDDDQVKSNSLVFEYLGVISFIATAIICALSYNIYLVLFPNEYLSGYIIAPYLFLAPLLQMLFQVAASQFLVIKKTWPNMFILSMGALVNILLNLLLIPLIGIEGAAISTLAGYFITDLICCIVLVRMKLMIVSKRFCIATLLMIVFFVIWRSVAATNILFGCSLAIILSILCLLLYKNEINLILKKVSRLDK